MKRTLLAIVLLLVPVSASALQTDELLALVAMPLAVAAVAEIADVPVNELIDVVTLLNASDVPPAQFLEVVRYAPAALTVEVEGPRLVEFVRVQHDEGLRGVALVDAIEERYRVVGLREVDLTPDRVVIADPSNFEPVRSVHPHGGPPGQIKKQIGVQTGAEVVHGRKGRSRENRVEVPPPRRHTAGAAPAAPPKDDKRGKGKDKDQGNKDKGNKDKGNKGKG